MPKGNSTIEDGFTFSLLLGKSQDELIGFRPIKSNGQGSCRGQYPIPPAFRAGRSGHLSQALLELFPLR